MGNRIFFRDHDFDFDFDDFGGFDRFGFRRPFFGFGFGFGGWGVGWGCGWGWPYWDWGWGCPGYWGLGWDYPGWGPYANGSGYDDAWEWDNNNTGNYGDYTGDANANYSDDSVYSNAPDSYNESNNDNESNNYNDENEQAAQGTSQPSSSNAVDPETIPTVVYLKDGTTLQMTAYWSSGNTLHYLNGQGGVSTLDVNQIDLQRTVDENAKHGVRFPIKPQPSPNAPTPSAPAVQPTSALSKAA